MKNNKVDASIRVIRLAAITGMSFTKIPYANHSTTPKQNSENMPSEKSFADLLFHVLMTCGKNEMVVRIPAEIPSNCVFISF